MRKFILSSIFGLLFSFVFCVGEAGAIFLLINPGSGPAGAGEAQVGKANDAYASYYNPAGLGFLQGTEVVLQHVNWLPNLVDDVFYDFLGFRHQVPGLGTFGGHVIYLNLGEQTGMDEFGNQTQNWSSYMTALTGSYGTMLSSTQSIGMNFKLFHQKLADGSLATANETGKPYSTDFAFDIGYLKKFGSRNQHQFGLSIQNIGPPIDFIDAEQADPAPTNMRFGIYTELYKDQTNRVHLLIDANKLLVASYSEMDWNGDGLIGDGYEEGNANTLLNCNDCNRKEYSHTDKWYQAIGTAWLDDWYYGGDYDLFENQTITTGYTQSKDYRIGGYQSEILEFSEHENACTGGNCTIYVPNYQGFCSDPNNPTVCYDENGNVTEDGSLVKYLDVPNDGIGECQQTAQGNWAGGDCDNQDNGELFYDYEISSDYEKEFNSSEYGVYNPFGDREKGSGDERDFSKELKEMIYNLGLEYWYTENVAFRLGFIYDEEGNVKNPTLGIGVKFDKYGFDFGYTSGDDTDARSNTMFFSLSLGI